MRRTVMGLVRVTGVMLVTGLVLISLASGGAVAQGSTAPQAPVGHRQPTATDVPPLPAPSATTPLSQSTTQQSTTAQSPAKSSRVNHDTHLRTRSGSFGGGPPVLQVGPSCEAAGRGAVVLGRNKEACLADETTAQDTLKQNWQKYAANDKTSCTGMTSTGGPASYVELLSCLEIMRDARNIQNADPLESDNTLAGTSSRRNRRR
jgi:hypothetical protein